MESKRTQYQDTYITERQYEIIMLLKKLKKASSVAEKLGVTESNIVQRMKKIRQTIERAIRTVELGHELGLIDDQRMMDLMKTSIRKTESESQESS
ncbi:MAG: hypothetical protein ACTSQY_05800 [Candidatus Odinarchaeia archaeon]